MDIRFNTFAATRSQRVERLRWAMGGVGSVVVLALSACAPLVPYEQESSSDSQTQIYTGQTPMGGVSTHSQSSYSGYGVPPPIPPAYPTGPTTVYSCNAGTCMSYSTEPVYPGYSYSYPYPYPYPYPTYPPPPKAPPVVVVVPPTIQPVPPKPLTPTPPQPIYPPSSGKPLPNTGYAKAGNPPAPGQIWRRPEVISSPGMSSPGISSPPVTSYGPPSGYSGSTVSTMPAPSAPPPSSGSSNSGWTHSSPSTPPPTAYAPPANMGGGYRSPMPFPTMAPPPSNAIAPHVAPQPVTSASGNAPRVGNPNLRRPQQ